jgi:GT2 family glycosyltransferase
VATAIVPVRSRVSDLDRALGSLRRQFVGQGDLELVVVHDGSCSAEQMDWTCARHSARLIRLTGHHGSAYTRNVGIDAANGRHLWFLDSDAEVADGATLEAMLAAASEPALGQVGGGRFPPGFDGTEWVAGWEIDWTTGASYCVFRESAGFRRGQLASCTYLPTFNCFMRRDVVGEVGWFDDQHPHLGEDKDFGARLAALGYVAAFSPEVAVAHHWSAEERYLAALTKQHRTQLRLVWRHRGGQHVPAAVLAQQARYVRAAFEQATSDGGSALAEAGERFVQDVLGLRPDRRMQTLLRRSWDLWCAAAWTVRNGRPAATTVFEQDYRSRTAA